MKDSLITASPQNASETLAAGVHPSSEKQQKTDGGEHASKWAVLSIVAVGVLMATLDSSIVNISLPAIAALGIATSLVRGKERGMEDQTQGVDERYVIGTVR